MTAALLISLVLATQNPVQIQLSSMSTANVQVAQNGYLLVLGRAERGQPIVIYPSRPGRGGHLAAGATVKLRSWRAASWVAVWSAQPFDGEPFTANTYWSSDSLRRKSDGTTGEALVAIARSMAGDAPIAYAVASAPPVSFALSQPDLRARRVTIPSLYYRFLSPQNSWIRQAKFAGGPPDMCNATTCVLSVWRQLGNMQFGNAP
jgi:hypothetical protein